jgi:protein-S-isoprenylcysteine O-methyltransferase Ste14
LIDYSEISDNNIGKKNFLNSEIDGPGIRTGSLAMKKLGLVVLMEGLQAAMFVAVAGRGDVPWYWAVLGIHAVILVLMVTTIDPDLLKERLHPGPGAVDPYVRKLLTPLFLLHYVVAALDVGKFHWSGTVPTPIHLAGLVGYALGLGLTYWAMRTNRFFSMVVRLQTDRGHRVVSSGPYGFVRHPGYLGIVFAVACGAVAIGSWWSLAALVPAVAFLVWRTGMEDRFLYEKLEGYNAYAGRVRSKLVPGLW